MALLFNASTEKVDHGSNTTLDDITTGTICAWVKPVSASTSLFYRIIQKGLASNFQYFLLNEAAGDLNLVMKGNTTNMVIQSATGVLNAGAWNFCAAVWVHGTSGETYHGTLTTAAIELAHGATYGVGSGGYPTNASVSMFVGNKSNDNGAFDGDIAMVQIWKDRNLTLGEIIAQQFRPHRTVDSVLFTHYGWNGVGTQPDWSGNGNSGAVTGATVSAHVPLGPAFGYDVSLPYIVPPSAGLPSGLSLLGVGV